MSWAQEDTTGCAGQALSSTSSVSTSSNSVSNKPSPSGSSCQIRIRVNHGWRQNAVNFQSNICGQNVEQDSRSQQGYYSDTDRCDALHQYIGLNCGCMSIRVHYACS